jgi:hypothetical protein
VRASVIAGVDASSILEFCKHILDLVPLPIECFVILDWQFPVLPRRNTGGNAFF